jgi:hypothetical protein
MIVPWFSAISLIANLGPLSAPLDCRSATSQYNQALDAASYAIKRYSSCLSYSAGKDDCSSEFRRLKYAQSDIETAVMEISSYCKY